MANEFIARNGIVSKSNLVVSGSLTALSTITAQTLVVETITSSISSITGSTNFGSIIGNTHTFTGSVNITGSTNLTGALSGTSATFAGNVIIRPSSGYNALFQVSSTTLRINYLNDAQDTNISAAYRAADFVWQNSLGQAAMVLTSGGNVGIRTTTPQASLHIAGLADQNALTIGASNAFEIFITGSDSANIYHASPNQAIYLNTNGGPLHLGPSAASTLLTITGSNVGIGTTNPTQALTVYKGGASNYLRVQGDNNASYDIAQQFTDGTNNVYSGMMRGSTGLTGAYTIFTGGAARINVISNGNVGIGTTNPLGTLSTIGGAVQIMGDYQNHQTIIKSAGANGTFNGALTITIPEMSNANVDGYGGYSCEVYVAGYQGLYCHAWFGGYINGGIVSSEATILRSSGGWSISQSQYGTYGQGFQFTIDYPSSIVHPAARIIFNKGGSPNSTAYPANSITAVFS